MEWVVISENELDGAHLLGGFIRAYCHIHGSDKQRSLSINEKNGFGQCHSCGAHVLVREINPEVAAHIERKYEQIASGQIRVLDTKYIMQAAQKVRQQKLTSRTDVKRWQREEIKLLREMQHNIESRLGDERARAYIEARGLSLEKVQQWGVGYIPDVPLPGKYAAIEKWTDHIVFPVYHPVEGLQFAGRNLHLWQPGMDENEHKALLEPLEKQGIRRWRKTHAGGWFNWKCLETAKRLVVVEGAFDALALMEAGLEDVLAIIGTALTLEWLPKRLQHVTLAFDSDGKGIEKSEAARDALYESGYEVTVCAPPQDSQGKDWNERYRRAGRDSLAAVLSIYSEQVQELADVCADCGTPLEDDARDFFYTDDGVCYCSVCRDMETGEPRQAVEPERELTPEEIVERFASAFPTWHVELVPTREAYKPAARPESSEQAHNLADYWKGKIA